MVLIFDGSSEIGAHVRSDLGYMICSRHLISFIFSVYLAIGLHLNLMFFNNLINLMMSIMSAGNVGKTVSL